MGSFGTYARKAKKMVSGLASKARGKMKAAKGMAREIKGARLMTPRSMRGLAFKSAGVGAGVGAANTYILMRKKKKSKPGSKAFSKEK